MKPSLEILQLSKSNKSFNFFKVDVDHFTPYWHYHPELELTLITKGQGTRFVGNSILPFYDNDLVLVGENVPHHWVSLKRNDDTMEQAFVFQFPKDIFKGIHECEPLETLFKNAEVGIQFLSPSPEIIQSIKSFGALNKMQQVSTLMAILSVLNTDSDRKSLSKLQYKASALKTRNQTKINETVSYILAHLDEKLTVNMLADFTNMVPQSFCRWFKKAMGNSFVTFLNAARVEKACQLLSTSELSIQQIAFECGFESLSHFNRTFKLNKGESPRAIRQKSLLYPGSEKL